MVHRELSQVDEPKCFMEVKVVQSTRPTLPAETRKLASLSCPRGPGETTRVKSYKWSFDVLKSEKTVKSKVSQGN